LGRITEGDGFIPSSKNALRRENEQAPKVDIKNFGVYALFETMLRDEMPILIEVFGKERAEELLTFAMMRWAHQSPIKRIGAYHAGDFCSEYWGKNMILSDKRVSAMLKSIGENRERVVECMKKLLGNENTKDENFVLMDSTHIMSSSQQLSINARGYNPSFDFGKQIRLMYMFSAQFKKPVYYRLINGNITDIASMALCVKEMDVKDVIFIADKGFYSAGNIKLLDEQNLNYLIPLRRNNPLIDYDPLSKTDFKKTIKYFIYQNRIIWYYGYDADGKHFITFMDERLRVEEEQDYLQRIETQPEKYNEQDYFDKLYRFGTLTLSYKMSSDCSAQKIYEAYKQRNEIEIMFDCYKNFLNADKMYMQDRYVLEGWLFANFIAMIAYYKLFNRLRNAKLLDKESPKDIIEMAKAVYQIRINGTWHCSEIPARVRKIFAKIDIDYLK
jgi:hypothetical protein